MKFSKFKLDWLVLPLIGGAPFFICNTDAIWLEGARSNLARLAERWNADAMDILLLVAASATSVGVDWAGDFLMDTQGRLSRRGESDVAPFVYAGVGIIKQLRDYGITTEQLDSVNIQFAEPSQLGNWLQILITVLPVVFLQVGSHE